MTYTVQFEAPTKSVSGYGEYTRDLLRIISKMNDMRVFLSDKDWGLTQNSQCLFDKQLSQATFQHKTLDNPDFHIQVGLPGSLAEWRGSVANLLFTAGTEVSQIPLSWVDLQKDVDDIVVPSPFVQETFKKRGIETHVIAEAIDTEIFNPTAHSVDMLGGMKEDFAFLSVAQWSETDIRLDRKNMASLINDFVRAFDADDNVALILKTYNINNSNVDRYSVIEAVDSIKNGVLCKHEKPPIYILHGELSREELASLYTHPKVKGYVTKTRGESFGRPIAEAACCDLPVITPYHTGIKQYMKKSNFLEVGAKKVTVPREAKIPRAMDKKSYWFEVEECAAQMVELKMKYDEWKSRAERHGKWVRQTKLNPHFVEDKIHKLINSYT